MKAPAFQWYAAEYLADERVMLMSLEAEGAYVRLLSLCWREGSIPANPLLLAAMCKHADQKVIKEVVPCFTKSGAPSGRLIHKRLEEEREKQEAYRAKQSAKGLMGGRPRKADDKPEESHGKATALPRLNHGLTTVKPVKSSSTSTSSSTTTNVVEGATDLPALQAEKAKQELVAARTDPDDLQNVDESPLVKPAAFAAILKATGYPNLDAERYRLQIAAKSEGVRRTASQWRSRIIEFVNNDYTAGRLLTYPVQTPNDIPSNWDVSRQGPYVLAPASLGIPNISSMLKPEFQIK